MIDKLNLTVYDRPDTNFLESQGIIRESGRDKLYKYMCGLDNGCFVLYRPHKFSEETNLSLPYSKVDIPPKYFANVTELSQFLSRLFNSTTLDLNIFNASRVDVASDIEGISTESILAIMSIEGIRGNNFNIYKGTIYGGSNPKIRIYDKVAEIKFRLRRGQRITEYERYLLESGKRWVRFEIQIRNVGKTLQEVFNDPVGLASYFDRLQFLKPDENSPLVFAHVWYRSINRKMRKEMEYLRDNEMVEKIKSGYISDVVKWFGETDPF